MHNLIIIAGSSVGEVPAYTQATAQRHLEMLPRV